MSSLADFVLARPKPILVAAAIFAALAGALGADVPERLLAAGFQDPDSESADAERNLKRALGYDAAPRMVVLARSRRPIRSPEGRAEVERLAAELRADPLVGRVSTFFGTKDRALLSRDGRATAIAVHFRSLSQDAVGAATKRLRARVRSPELDLAFGGFGVGFIDTNDLVREDLLLAELIAFPALFVLLLLVFRGVVAALVPLAMGATAVLGAFLGLRLLSEALPISIFAVNVVTGLGLGLAIDYSLFLVWRYREELDRIGPGSGALRATLRTAGRTVAFSGLTVALAMAALTIFPERFLYSMGLGGTLVALMSAGAALLVVPALLALLGPRVNALSLRRGRATPAAEGRWYRFAHRVMRRPLGVATLTATLLIALGTPFLGAKFTGIDARALPDSHPARQVEDALTRDFQPYRDAPITVLAKPARADAAGPALARLRGRISALDGVAGVGPARVAGEGTAFLEVVSATAPSSEGSARLVEEIRGLLPPGRAQVGGRTAEVMDFKADVRARLPALLAIVGATTFLLLFAMTGSVVLPLKAFLMNLLTLSAAFGLLVLVFQHGRLEQLLDYRGQGAIETASSVLLFALAFALSTDYGVFLLARIKELRDAGHPNAEAIALGMQRTGRLITAAALVLCVAFLAFVSSTFVFIKEFSLGVALAIAIDATLVRALLVPSLMCLLGRWNWWAPSPLRRLHAHFTERRAVQPAG